MYWLRILSFLLTLSASVNLTSTALGAGHTNQCVRDLGGIMTCQSRNVLGLPEDLQACCDGVRQLATDSCHCNPAIDAILGTDGTKIYQLETVCRIAQPLKWTHLSPFFLKKCDAVKTHEYGCQKTDVEIDGERMKSILSFQTLFTGTNDEKICLDTPAFTKHMGQLVTPDIQFNVPYGIGTYIGTQSVAEYLGMAFSGLTHGFWQPDTTPDPTKRARLEVSPDGSTWMTGGTGKGDFLRGQLSYNELYVEQDIKFEGCNTQISEYNVMPTEGLRFLIERIVQTTDLSKRWGVEDICRYHTKYCADDPETRQYQSEEECRSYIRNLPLYTEACGPNRPLSGHSLSCKYKHHFMIPANPKMHCAHIGPKGNMDPDQHLKCDDSTECSQDQGQDTWPPVLEIGDKTPVDVRKVFEQSNIDYENEPLGCAIPSVDDGHHHQ